MGRRNSCTYKRIELDLLPIGTASYVGRETPDLTLSSNQQNVFAGWKRPHELLASLSSTATPTMVGSGVVDLVQDITTDCSVVASLCAATSRAERGHHKVPASTFLTGQPCSNSITVS
jgi:hypothetical protein